MLVMRTRHVLILPKKMGGSTEDMCSSCFESTKYTCLKSMNHFCMRCSAFKNDEDVAGRKAGSSVAYCESCFEEKMTKPLSPGREVV